MIAIAENLRAAKPWRELIRALIQELGELIPGRVRLVVALPSPEDRLYDSNVLVVLDEHDPEATMLVMRAAVRAEDRLGVGGVLSPLIVGPEDRDAVERFLSYRREDAPWGELLATFLQELGELIPGRVRLVVALPSPEDRLYDSNVLVVLDEHDPEATMLVMRAAVRAEDRLGVGGVLSPLIVGPEDRDAVERFREHGGKVLEGKEE